MIAPGLKLLLPALLLCGTLTAQVLTLNPTSLAFGDVFENLPDSIALDITNPLSDDVEIEGMVFFDTYGQPAFSSITNNVTIAAGGTETVHVRFQPRHNIVHNTEVVLLTSKGSWSVDITGNGRYASNYYPSTFDRSEQGLKDALNTLVGNNYNSLGYNSARDEMYMVIDNKKVNGQGAAQNEFESVYIGATLTGYASRSAAQNQGYNTEHTFPQSMFSSSEPERSDIHHLFITNGSANSVRGNSPFGVVSGSGSWSQGGSKLGGGVFEPRDEQKGTTARAMMYFVVRYGDLNTFFAPQESILRQWHNDFPPDQEDINRNDDIHAVQNNRNPFVDYPQFIERITTLAGNSSSAPVVETVFATPDTLAMTPLVSTVENGTWAVVNTGNQPLTITGASADLTNAPAGAVLSGFPTSFPLTIQPGDALNLTLNYEAGPSLGSGFATVSLLTDWTSTPSIDIVLDIQQAVSVRDLDKQAPGWFVFPNPAKDEVHILWRGWSLPESLTITDAQGRLVEQVTATSMNFRLDVSKWANGVYWLQSPGTKSRRKLVISR